MSEEQSAPVGANFGPYPAFKPESVGSAPTTAPTLLSLLDQIYEAGFSNQWALANNRIDEIKRRFERAYRDGASDSSNGRRILAILDGVK